MIKIYNTRLESEGRVGLPGEIERAKIETFIGVDSPVDMAKLVRKVHFATVNALCAERPRVERVIANGPATVVFWDDGEKTVVKCRECNMCDATKAPAPSCTIRYDHEKAVMAAMLKRLAPGWQDDVRKAEKEVR